MDRSCVNCGDKAIVHRTVDELIIYCPSCGHETKEACTGPRPAWDRAPVRKSAHITPISPKDRADKKERKQTDKRDYKARGRGAR